jgi:DNA invertase Pin-like site-specific DNA recombinase
MKAVIYARVSSRGQEETGYSLPAQEKLLREYAERKGFEVVRIFSVSESASGKHKGKSSMRCSLLLRETILRLFSARRSIG